MYIEAVTEVGVLNVAPWSCTNRTPLNGSNIKFSPPVADIWLPLESLTIGANWGPKVNGTNCNDPVVSATTLSLSNVPRPFRGLAESVS